MGLIFLEGCGFFFCVGRLWKFYLEFVLGFVGYSVYVYLGVYDVVFVWFLEVDFEMWIWGLRVYLGGGFRTYCGGVWKWEGSCEGVLMSKWSLWVVGVWFVGIF